MTTTTEATPRRRGFRRWGTTLAATAVSWWALDVVATASGALLVASSALSGAGRELVLAVLAASYVTWAAGMRVNLAANAQLLERTGTSTRASSKAAFDLAGRAGASPRARRLAAAAGYIVVEVLTETVYYVGAFGTAALSDAVDAHDALCFLAGANLGAALFEYGLGRGTSAMLRERD